MTQRTKIRLARKAISFFLLAGLFLSDFSYCLGEEGYNRFDIKYGMHERVVNQKYGSPILAEKTKTGLIPKKKALYERGSSSYMILHFFSGRIYKITLLEDMDIETAEAVFSRE